MIDRGKKEKKGLEVEKYPYHIFSIIFLFTFVTKVDIN